MGLRIATNMASISAQRAMGMQTKRQEHAAQALASGSRIVRAADDAAGLAISEGMKSEIRGTAQARNNAYNAISAMQVGEGGLSEQTNLLTRLRELAVQSASDTLGNKERNYLQLEAASLVDEIDRISKTTKFGDKNLLDGSNSGMEFHVGTTAGKENIIEYKQDSNASISELGIDGVNIADKDGARDLLTQVDTAIEKVSKMRAGFGAMQSRLESTMTGLDVRSENLSAARSRIADADVAKESSEMASSTMLQQAALSVLAQANQQPMVAMKLIG
ncbi:MAG: flagellin [Bdellovibrionales bacterium RIFCSPHIGHO2_01_FULL_40_29]|nr:MAG: flagellin [Bdellovibrionales bacterium RIFCSPHIGHO2_01_FULL_40_29]OFZ34080.1 MAG: flagellin [Bdellovibrionales bacterium RIFCSPHIGHO2_02_FULL_40_15]